MADTNTRQGKRTPVTLKIKFKSETLEQFIERYAVDVSQGGIFIRTKEPLAVGTQMKFEFQLKDASPLIAGEGTVVWTRENDPSRPAIAPGMGVRFDRLADGSQTVLEKILAEKAKQAPSRSGSVTAPGDSNKAAAMFTDTPTRVAPAPVQEALGLRSRAESEQTPLPKPVPFHSDADDFDEKAFEEATKVRSLEELAAQSAGLDNPLDDVSHATKIMPADELAIRRQEVRADSTLSDPPLAEPPPDGDKVDDESDMSSLNEPAAASVPDRESAPALPSAPVVTPARPRTPTPAGAAPAPAAARASSPSTPPATALADTAQSGATKLGMEPAKATTGRSASPSVAPPVERPSDRAVEAAKPVAPSQGSKAPLVIGIVVALAAAAAAVYFLAIKKDPAPADSTGSGSAVVNTGSGSAVETSGSGSATTPIDNGSGSAIATSGSGSAAGSGSATAMTGSGAGSAATPAAPLADTTVTSTAKGATVEILGTDAKGNAPFTTKLEKGKMFRARVTAPGFASSEVDVKGGDRTSVNLARKPRVLTVTTDPPGAAIYIDNADTGKLTPADVELTAAQAARPRIRLSLRRTGFRPLDQTLDASAWKESDARMTSSFDGKLVQAQVVHPPANPSNGGNTGSAATPAGTGSATSTGTGSATTTPPPANTGSATTTPTPAPTPPAPTPTPPPPAPSAGSASTTTTGGASSELK